MAELKKAAKEQQRFGSVRDIGRADFVRDVTNAGADVHVVVHLHKDGCATLEPSSSWYAVVVNRTSGYCPWRLRAQLILVKRCDTRLDW